MLAAAAELDRVRLLVEAKANVNCADVWGWTPLHHACHHRKHDVAAFLLDHGAEIDPRDRLCRQTPLRLALNVPHLECVMLLLERGADVAATGLTELEIASRLGFDKSLKTVLRPQSTQAKRYIRRGEGNPALFCWKLTS